MAIFGGSRRDDFIVGTSGSDIITAGAGNDSISAGNGNDVIDAGAGNDGVLAGTGNDLVRLGAGDDVLVDGGGSNLVYAGAGSDRIVLAGGRTVLFGEAGDDVVELGTAFVTADFGSGNDRAVYDATLAGRLEPARLSGGAGTDTLELSLTAAQARDAAVQADLARYATFLATGSDAPFAMASLNLRLADFERVVTKASPEALLAVADEAMTTEGAAVTVAVLGNDIGTGLQVIAVGGTGASIGDGGTSLLFDPGERYAYLAAGATAEVALEYTVQAAGGATARAAVTVVVTGLNAAPTDLVLDNDTVVENAAGAVIGGLRVTDADTADTYTWTVDDDRLEVVDGQLRLKAGESFDFERGFVVPVEVTATDLGNAAITRHFELTVEDVNDAPDAGLDQTIRVAETVAAGSLLTQLLGSDQDPGTTLVYSLTAGNALGLFAIDAATGDISLAQGKTLDYESIASHELTVTVSDGTLSDTMRVTVEVTDVQVGPIDLVSANGIGNSASVRFNDGSGGFSGSGAVAVGFQPLDVALGDLDGDGDLDFVTGDSDGKASVRLNDGAGAFSGTGGASVPGAVAELALGDLDGDGDLDLVTVNRDIAIGPDQASVRLNDGQGRFSGSQEVTVGDQARTVALGDLDGDGDLDFLTGDYEDNTVSVRLNDGAGVFSGTGSFAVSDGPTTLALGDLDGDGDLDLVTGYAQAFYATVHLNDGEGGFTAAGSTLVGSTFSLALGDLDGDGDLDLAAAGYGSGAVLIRLNDGNGAFSGQHSVSVGSGWTSVALGDLDGDDDLDLASVNSGGASFRFNDGSGVFSGSGSVALTTAPITVALGELNGGEATTASGLPDLGALLPNAAELDYLI